MLPPDVVYKAVFTNLAIIGFKDDRSVKGRVILAMIQKADPTRVEKEAFL